MDKEIREIRRDPVTVGVALLLPLVMLFLFGYGLIAFLQTTWCRGSSA